MHISMETDDLDALLIQSAHLNARIRKRLIQFDQPPNARLFTYVLLLQNNNIYVLGINS